MLWRVSALCLSVALFVVGCAFTERAYEGPTRDPEAVAAINAGALDLTRKILINSIDGKTFSPSLSATEVLPGQHRVEIWYWDMVFRFPFWTSYAYAMTAEFNAEAGKAYEFDGEGEWSATPAPITVRLIDTATQSVVWQDEVDASKPIFVMR